MQTRGLSLLIILIIIVSVVFLEISALFVIALYISNMFLRQHIEQVQHESTDYGLQSERISVKTDDNATLAA